MQNLAKFTKLEPDGRMRKTTDHSLKINDAA